MCDHIARQYERGSHLGLFVFSVSDRDSFENIKSLCDGYIAQKGHDHIMILIGSKADSERVVSEEVNLVHCSIINKLGRTQSRYNEGRYLYRNIIENRLPYSRIN